MQLRSKQAIVRLRAMKTKVIGFENTVEGAISTIVELESQIDEKDRNLVAMSNTIRNLEEENVKLRSQLKDK